MTGRYPAGFAFGRFIAPSETLLGATLGSAIAGALAIVGSVSATRMLIARDRSAEGRRTLRNASAIALDLRMHRDALTVRLIPAAEQRRMIFWSGFDDLIFRKLSPWLADLGSTPFLTVRNAYRQLKQVNHLQRRFRRIDDQILTGQTGTSLAGKRLDNIGHAYVAAIHQALRFTEAALDALRLHAHPDAYSQPLPPLEGLTEHERLLYRKEGAD